MPTRLPPETTLLCESCGYDIDSLPHTAACPECGRPCQDSLPSRRVGTPVQQRLTIASLIRTWHLTLTRPRSMFDLALVGSRFDIKLWALSLLLASVVAPMGWLALMLLDEANWGIGPDANSWSGPFLIAVMAFYAVNAAMVLFFVLALLTTIEELGIRFWGPRRGWRITPAIAKTICAHASVGWLLGSILMVAGHLLGLVLADIPNHHNLGAFRGPMQLAPLTLPALGFIAGMLTFEILVYIGMTRMKFANRHLPAPQRATDSARSGA